MLGTVTKVRALSAWPNEIEEASDQDIEDALVVATQNIRVQTGVEEATWNLSPHVQFKEMAFSVAEHCAASTVVLRVNNPEVVSERSRQLKRLCDDQMEQLINALGTILEDNPSFIDATASYTTYPLNPLVDPYDPLI